MAVNVFISPHPDDIALSIGCYIQSLTGRKIIITSHSKSMDDDRRTDQTARRKKEELAFAEKVEAEVVFLDLPDTNYRGVRWEVFDYSLKIEDNAFINSLLLSELNKIAETCTLFCPLGIGLHPDHIACYYSSLQILCRMDVCPAAVLFYEEIPYSFFSETRLPSQELLYGTGRIIEHSLHPEEKRDMLSCYPSQLQPAYIREIVAGCGKERMIGYDYTNISKDLCTVEYLALLDGIRLI